MPYGKGKKLPEQVTKALPAHAQSIWRKAFNAAYEEHGEERAFKIAWGAVKNAGYRRGRGGEWVKDAEWDESKHPRDEGGKFTDSSGGAGGHPISEPIWSPERHELRGIDPQYAAPSENHDEEDEDLMKKRGKNWEPVLNEAWSEYNIRAPQVDEIADEFGLKTPEEAVEFIRDNYVGQFSGYEDLAKDYMDSKYPRLPQALIDSIDMDSLGEKIVEKGSSYFAAINQDEDTYDVFKRPASTRAKDSVALSVMDSGDVDGRMIVLDAGANVHRSTDGYLVASPRIARAGIQVYKGHEMGALDRETVRIYRPEKEVFAPDTIRSYAHKPITNDHPREAVTADNWRKYAVGHTADEILRDGGFIRIPIMISDAGTIKDVEDGKAELSLGYTMEVDWTPGKTPDGEAYDGIQRKIRANHLAIVAAARGGRELRVGDSSEGDKLMKTITVDGASVQVDDTAGVIVPRYIERLEKGVADAAVALKTAQDAATKAATDVATLTAENATLKKKIEDAKTTPQQLDQMVRDRAIVIAQARSVLGDRVVTDGRTDGDIKRQVVDAAMGAAAKSWNDEQVASSFAVLTKDAKIEAIESRDGLTVALSNPGIRVDARDAAYTEYENKLTNAWKRPAAQ